MKDTLKILGITLGILTLLCAIGFGLRGAGLITYQFWAPKEEAARRTVFEETKSFTQGTIQELDAAYRQYSDPALSQGQRDALRAIVLHQTADFDTNKLPPYLSMWVAQLRGY